MTLCRLIYCSQAIPELNYSALKDIMEKSQKNNQPVGVTGILSYGNSMFLQILEGSRKEISDTYNRIVNDKRHYNQQIIEFVEVDTRLFTEWSMKVVQLGKYSPEKIQMITLKYCSQNTFDPFIMNPNQCLNFLLELYTIVLAS